MSDPPGDPSSPRLTPRERDVLIELCRPLAASGDAFTEPASIRQIADSLFVSEAAVKQHLARLYDKFEIYDDSGRRRVHLANAVMERGVLTRTDLLASSPSGEAPSQAVEEQLGPARAAAGGRDWTAAFDAFVAAESAGTELGAGDLELLGEAAMYIDRHPESIAARQRAHSIYLAAGDQRSAARVALALVINHAARLAPSVAGGWLNSARRLLEGCDDCPEQGYVVATTALFALLGGDAAAGRGYAQEAFAFGQRFDDADLRALGLALEGAALARLGEV
ncbi:MAG: helix-turn-helix transcriptional regulator, partial [Acidimicrobiia bacterium]